MISGILEQVQYPMDEISPELIDKSFGIKKTYQTQQLHFLSLRETINCE